MAPAYRLIYHDIRGLAEPIRLLFKYGGIEFEDVRIKREDWPEKKNDTPFGVLPLLEHNGQIVGQSLSIARYIAKKVDLAGNNDWENAEIDYVVDVINDLRLKFFPIFFEEDETKKQVMVEEFAKETLPYYLSRMEDMAQKNNGYLVLGRLTWADVYFSGFPSIIGRVVDRDILANYPNLKSAVNNVIQVPAIKKWIETRPESEL